MKQIETNQQATAVFFGQKGMVAERNKLVPRDL